MPAKGKQLFRMRNSRFGLGLAFLLIQILAGSLLMAPSPASAAGTAKAAIHKPARPASGPDRSILRRKNLIYGSEIGAWEMNGGNAINNPLCRKLVTGARIRVIRWGNWAKFSDMQQGGSNPKLTLENFSHVIDGIRGLGAVPFIKLPPIWDKQCNNAIDAWNLDWQKEIIRVAGKRVQLYEFGNEPNHYCKWDGRTYAYYWNYAVPQLKKYARSLGFEIFIGGPSQSNSRTKDIAQIRTFLEATKTAYTDSRDRDFIPDFISTHTYLTEQENASIPSMLATVNAWGTFYDSLRATIDDVYGKPLGPQIPIADSEYNFTINHASPLQNSQAFTDAYMKAMMNLFRSHHVWMANQFTIQSHRGEALDMLTAACTPKPLYNSFKALSTGDALNK